MCRTSISIYLHQKKKSENQSKRINITSSKRHLITEFVKLKRKKLTPEIIDADTPPDNSLQNCEKCDRLSFENMLLKEKIKVLEEEKNKLEEELKCSNVYAGSLKNRLFSYENCLERQLD